MPRSARLWKPESVYHVIARGNRRQSIVADDADRRRVLAELKRALLFDGGALFAYCLMPNHLHLLLRAALSLSAVMHRALGGYAEYFNDRYDHYGHLFQDRYKSLEIESRRYLSAAVRYIHGNPTAAGLAAEDTDYAWSSARAYAGLVDDELVDIVEGLDEVEGVILPEAADDFPRIVERALEGIAQEAAFLHCVTVESLRSGLRGPALSAARRHLAKTALAAGYRAMELAAFLGCSRAAISKLLAD